MEHFYPKPCRGIFLHLSRLFFILLLLSATLPTLSQTTVQIGTGNSFPTNTLYGPVYRFSATSTTTAVRSNILYTAAEMAAAGIPAGATITQVEFFKGTPSNFVTPADYTMLMANTTNTSLATTLTWASIQSSHTTVYTNSTFNLPATTGWVPWVLSTPFVYTGGALEIATQHTMAGNGGATGNITWQYTGATGSQANQIVGVTGTTLQATLNGTVADYKNRPNIKITFTTAAGCTAPPVAGTATASASTSCAGVPVNLSLTGNSVGSGQTYVWQTSSTQSGTYTDISTPSGAFGFVITPSATAWYRAAVTCNGQTSFSDAVQVTTIMPLSGVYTVGGPAGPNNFTSLTAAANALNCAGVSGAVTFNVAPGTYSEQLKITQVSGASASNTITFNGGGATINHNATVTTERGAVVLDGADHVRINNFVIDVSAGTFGWGIHLTGQADSNIISNNVITTNTVSTSTTNYAGIVFSGSFTALSSSGNNANGNLVTGNTITGGYNGISVYGSSTAGQQNLNNRIVNNLVRDYYNSGILITYQQNALVSGNDISRPTRTNSTSASGVEIAAGNLNALVEKNRIHNLFDAMTTNTSISYGVYVSADGLAGQENLIVNNVIYNMNSNGTVYGIYNTGGNYMKAFHNSILLDFAGTTSGATYGLYQTTAANNIDYFNNIVVIRRGGTGIKRAIHFNTTTSTAISSNNNVLYLDAATGTDNHLGQYGTTTYTTLADWQTANSNAYDQASLSVDPLFVSGSTGNLFPTNSQLAVAGTSVGVTTDILGTTRNASTPTPGAYEVQPTAGTDLGAVGLFSPGEQDCYSASQTVTVIIRNYSASTHNFSTNPATVSASVSGVNPQVFAPITINTGSLPAGDSLNVVITTTYNMSALGLYTFNASVTTAGDASTGNNGMIPVTKVLAPLEAGTASSTGTNYCVTPGTPTLSLSGNAGGNYQWQSAASASGPWTNVGTNSSIYTPASPITANTFFRAIASCGANTDTTNIVQVLYSNPAVLSTTAGTRCGPGTVVLGATASAGATLNWYDSPTGGTPLATGTSYTTPSISSNTNFYVSASIGGTAETAAKPVPTTTVNTTGNDWGLVFNVNNAAITLNSVDIYSVGAAAGTISVRLTDNTGTVLATAGPFAYGPGTTANPTVVTLPLNFSIPVGTGYRLLSTAMSGGSVIRETSGNVFPYASPSGNVAITSGYISGTNNTYYWFYNWQVSTGCESPRQAVAATITTPQPLDVTPNTTICNNTIQQLTISSNPGNYNNYIWTPQAGLFTDAAATIPYTGGSATTVYIRNNTGGTYTYFLNANNTVNSCSNLDSVKITVLPTSVSINPSLPNVCVSGAVSYSLNPATGYTGAQLQWQSSTDGVNYTNIGGATGNTYTTPVLTSTTYYRIQVRDAAGNICLQAADTMEVNSPQLTGSTPGARCGPGTITLSATGSAGTTINWYGAASGGTVLGTGNNFTTPILNNTTTYYVAAAAVSALQSLGVATPAALPNSGTNSSLTVGMLFTVSAGNVNIASVDIFPTVAVGTPFKIVVRSGSGTGTVVATYEALTTVTGTVAAPVAQTVPVNFNLPPGSYAMTFFGGAMTAPLTGTAIYPGALRNNPATGATFPYSIPGAISITNGTASNVWYYFYNWRILVPCESARTAVVATVNAGPSFDVTDSTTICNGAIKALTVNTPAANFTQYTWTPSAGLFTDAAATIPYTGGSATTVYVRNTTAATYTYIANAVNGTTSCTGIDSVKVTVLPAGVVVNATPTQICVSGQTSLSITPATGYTGAQLQWQSSTDGVNYTNIAGATTTTYTTPTITQTTTYRLVIRDKDGNICQQPTRTIQVNSPSVVSSQGAVNCGSGVLTLTATGSAGTTLNWYTSANGGSPVGSGGSYTTPNLSTTTTYYVSATSGGAIQGLGPISPSATGVTGAATGTSTAQGILFDVLNVANGVNIQSVDIFPTAAVGTPFTIVVRQGPGTTGTILRTYSGVTTVSGTVGAPVAQTVPVNFQLPAGFDYVMLYSTAVASVRNTGATVYPQSIPGEISLTNGVPSGTWNYFYNWRVGNGCESPRVAVTATISTNTAINTQPVGQTICAGAPLTLSVNAVGATLTYQWFKGTQAITGATQSTYTIAAAQVSDAGTYSVRVTGACGTVTSQVVTINVNATNSWLGTTSNDWHNPANWCGSVPTATSDIVIPSGTPFQPVITALAEARNLTINTGASVTVQQNGFLSIFGNLQNNGTFSAANGFVGFKGAQPQTTTAITAGTIVMNGAGGLTLQGAMSAQTLILENGNITLGTHNLTVGSSANGSVQSHVITNGTGSVISQNVSAANTIVPVGANGDAYNPVIITNGQNRDYTVRVAIGLNPGVTNSARAINRTWTIQPSAAVTQPVELTLQWADTHGNGSVTPGSDMEVGLNSGGAQWNILTPPGGLTPVGGPAARRVTVLAQSFGNFIVSSPGGFSYPLAAPSIDPDVRGAQLLPNITQGQTTLRVSVERPTQITWVLVDGGGRVVERFSQNYTQGVHDRTIRVHSLANGQYYLMGYTKKGRTSVLKLVKQ